ncbi:hypothetical protein BD289DRAFT_364607 [Coniella lustricola]|uniref:Swiss Army Knife RNA repair protein HAD domain-containing protein n=1 Tax=Coniella lustricola TaxID=2025994 RepID=A0A2T3ADE8_9PEZI|nr:hypothetical protein BD289DRAFT_364607 [Coniella lustricola]
MRPNYGGAAPQHHQQQSHRSHGSSSSSAIAIAIANGQQAALTPTAMGRWSVASKKLPPVDQIKALHIYDFDNTLFKTPMPNLKLWNNSTIGLLANPDAFANGGWWHDSRILAATGEGLAKEEQRAWEGWWNEKIVELVQLTNNQKDALCVLLTGRSESGFGELIKRIVASKQLDFDMVSLKPAVGPGGERFSNTMHFKQVFLRTLMETYRDAEEIRIYEDRPKHTKGFREFLSDYNTTQHGPDAARNPILGEVIQVADISTKLNPVVEVAEIQHIINDHNKAVANNTFRGERLMIKKTVFFTGYMLSSADTKRLLTLASIPAGIPDSDLKYLGNNILICPRPCPAPILDKVGGMGAKMRWAVTGVACHDNSVWAACVRPVPEGARFHTENPSPLVVLALKKGAKPSDASRIKNWQPVPPEKAFEFDTTVGEKVLLRIESDHQTENSFESLFPHKTTNKRKHTGSDDSPARRGDRGGYHGPRGGNFGGSHSGNRGRGGFNANNAGFRGGGYRGASRGGPRGGLRGGRGGGNRGSRGGSRHYHSLDDVGKGEFGNGASPAMYDDAPGSGQWTSFNSSRSGGAGGGSGNTNNNNNNNNNGGGGDGGVEQYY